jgi:hypothetical protein
MFSEGMVVSLPLMSVLSAKAEKDCSGKTE